MVRKRDSFWDYVDESNEGKKFQCKFCKNTYDGGISILKSHLSRIPGHDIASCTLVSNDVQAAAAISIGDDGDKRIKKIGVEKRGISIDSSMGIRQTTIPGLCATKNKELVDKKVAEFFFINNIAFNVIQSKSFIEMIKYVAEFGVGYKLPSYTTLRTKLVMEGRTYMEEYVNQLKESWKFSSCTIVSDGSSCKRGKSYINVIACCPKEAVFLRSYEKSGDRKTGNFLKDLLASCIDEIGPQNVVQIITDNASNYGSAGELLMERYPHIYKTNCAAHGVQLLLKDIYENVLRVKEIFDNAKAIVDFMYKRPSVTVLLRNHTGDKDLKIFLRPDLHVTF